jgi:FKBP-type peptidyl-prolyl cis-trans isomerase
VSQRLHAHLSGALVPEQTPTRGLAISLKAPKDLVYPPSDALTTESGLVLKVLVWGNTEDYPGPSDAVTVHYVGWTKEGEVFDSSIKRRTPSKFAVDQVIKGWAEGLQLMSVGQRSRLWIPSSLAYGDSPKEGLPAGDLVFDVELIALKPVIDELAPPDLTSPPADAIKTESRLMYKVLFPGSSPLRPGPHDLVKVHYTGWTSDGTLFDSTRPRGRPSVLEVSALIAGWQEAIQLMTKGQRNRLWIPSHLAYGSRPSVLGAPAGMLCIDVELVDVGRRRPPR